MTLVQALMSGSPDPAPSPLFQGGTLEFGNCCPAADGSLLEFLHFDNPREFRFPSPQRGGGKL
jgi:hypothetical protein